MGNQYFASENAISLTVDNGKPVILNRQHIVKVMVSTTYKRQIEVDGQTVDVYNDADALKTGALQPCLLVYLAGGGEGRMPDHTVYDLDEMIFMVSWFSEMSLAKSVDFICQRLPEGYWPREFMARDELLRKVSRP
ncbi:MAG: hypothetical protein FOGNACKC_00822 [Anaerolineae bacterium]|nr:hypothetical protein [Anaerolineae bacterium]